MFKYIKKDPIYLILESIKFSSASIHSFYPICIFLIIFLITTCYNSHQISNNLAITYEIFYKSHLLTFCFTIPKIFFIEIKSEEYYDIKVYQVCSSNKT